MNKRNNNAYLGVLLTTLIPLSMLFSALHFPQIQPANAQNSTTSNTGILPPISQEQQQQLATNGTSFDGFIKHRIAAMTTAKIPVNYTALDPTKLSKGVTLCVSPLGKAFAQTACDFAIAALKIETWLMDKLTNLHGNSLYITKKLWQIPLKTVTIILHQR